MPDSDCGVAQVVAHQAHNLAVVGSTPAPAPSEQVYTSTGAKYARHWPMIAALRNGVGMPPSLQVSPTNRCNLRCVFCSVDERDLKLEWDLADLCDAITTMHALGVRTVEFSGGGDPTVYPHLPNLVKACQAMGLQLGMITNGILLKELPRETLEAFTWIRVSMVTLDYYDTLVLPEPWPSNVTLGMSYVLSQINYTGGKRRANNDDYEGLKRARDYAIRYGARYVRCVPECFTPGEDKMAEVHAYWEPLVASLGPPLFFQHKWQKQATACWMDAVKPCLHTDGFLYPCNSVSLNTAAHRDFDPQWRLVHWTGALDYFSRRGAGSLGYVGRLCDRCTFTRNNAEIESLLVPLEHEAFA